MHSGHRLLGVALILGTLANAPALFPAALAGSGNGNGNGNVGNNNGNGNSGNGQGNCHVGNDTGNGNADRPDGSGASKSQDEAAPPDGATAGRDAGYCLRWLAGSLPRTANSLWSSTW